MKKPKVLGMGFILFICLCYVAFAEDITLTTYYPAPYGVYNQMVTQTLGVGDTDADGGLNSNDAPDPTVQATAGDLWIAGDVGIGTTDPSFRLSIAGEGPNYPEGEPELAIDGASNNAMLNPGISTMRYRNSLTSPNIVQDGDQLFCIHVYGYDGVNRHGPSAANHSEAAEIKIEVDGTPTVGSNVPGRIKFATSSEGGGFNAITRMVIKNNGNVGIGTDDPTDILTIVTDGSTNSGDIELFTYSDTTSPSLDISRAAGDTSSPSTLLVGDVMGSVIFAAHEGNDFYPGASIRAVAEAGFGTVTADVPTRLEFTTVPDVTGLPAGTPTTRMVIANNGNVGIGTTNPQETLHIYGNGEIRLEDTSVAVWFIDTDIGHDDFRIAVAEDILKFQSDQNSDDTWDTRMVMDDNGNVGIGTIAPSDTLTVVGTTWCTSGTWDGSDVRWKENVKPLPNPLDKLRNLRAVSFDWNREEFEDMNFPQGKQIGIIAQELEKEFPELVATNNDGYKAIAYDRLTAVLLEAIKAQQQEIEVLREQVNRLIKLEQG